MGTKADGWILFGKRQLHASSLLLTVRLMILQEAYKHICFSKIQTSDAILDFFGTEDADNMAFCSGLAYGIFSHYHRSELVPENISIKRKCKNSDWHERFLIIWCLSVQRSETMEAQILENIHAEDS
ncbi:hypothetical protein Bca4012_056909 [Brassica carinata]